MTQKIKNCIRFLVLGSLLGFSQQETGNWLMYFGTNKISEKFSIHSEAQYRNHTISPTNTEQLLLRTGLNYHFKPNASATYWICTHWQSCLRVRSKKS